MNWYAVACRTNQEDRASHNLFSQQFEVFNPLIPVEKMKRGELITTQEQLFKDYVFVRFDPTIRSAALINNTFGVRKIVSFGNVLAVVHDEIINSLRNKLNIAKNPVALCHKQGDKVTIKGGPFNGIEAVFVEPDGNKRSMIMISLIGKQTPLTVDNTQIA